MNIHLEVIMFIAGSRSLHCGSFTELNSEFKKEPNWTAAVTSYQFIQRIKFNTGYQENTEILKVTYDGEINITELVKKIRPVVVYNLPY